MCEITIIFRYAFNTKETKTIQMKLEGNETIYDVCSKNGIEYQWLSFEEYYGKNQLMQNQNCFPYIKRENDQVEWNVPYDDVIIKEIVTTHELTNILIVDVNYVGSAFGFLNIGNIHSWFLGIKTALDYVGYANTLKTIVQFLINTFGKKKEKIPCFHDFYNYIISKDCWTENELSNELGITHEYIKMIIESIGYEEHDGKYWKNSWKLHQFEQANIAAYKNYIGDSDSIEIKNKVDEINRDILYLQGLGSKRDLNKLMEGRIHVKYYKILRFDNIKKELIVNEELFTSGDMVSQNEINVIVNNINEQISEMIEKAEEEEGIE